MRNFSCLPLDESLLNTRLWLLSLCPSQKWSFDENYFCSMLSCTVFDNDTQNPCIGFSIKICNFPIKILLKCSRCFSKQPSECTACQKSVKQTIQGVLSPIGRESAGYKSLWGPILSLGCGYSVIRFYLRRWKIINSQRRAGYFTPQETALQMTSDLENKHP